jgi:alkylated DNA repair dioxygenase AlkB
LKSTLLTSNYHIQPEQIMYHSNFQHSTDRNISHRHSKNLPQYVYELFPTQSCKSQSVITLNEGSNNHIEVNSGIFIDVQAHDGVVFCNGTSFAHNAQIEGEQWQRVVSICKRGELNIIQSTMLNNTLSELQAIIPEEWRKKCIEMPHILLSDPSNKTYLLRIRWNDSGSATSGYMLQVKLLGTSSSLLWSPYPSETIRPNMNDMMDLCKKNAFHKIVPPSKYGTKKTEIAVPLSVRMACFERDYPFNGTILRKEQNTPLSLLQLCKVVESMFYHGTDCGPNMILVNYYATGAHKISQHQDNGTLMGTLQDVYAFVDGFAREMVFGQGWGKSTKVILRAKVPAGFYCMHGDTFQQQFNHEIKETFAEEYEALCSVLRTMEEFKDLKDDFGRVKIPLAEHITQTKQHQDAIRKIVVNGSNHNSGGYKQTRITDMFAPRMNSTNNMPNWFDEWIQPRISYTLRRFDY